MRSVLSAAVMIAVAASVAAAQGGRGFNRPLGRGNLGGGLAACRQEVDLGVSGSCGEPDVSEHFVTPFALWGEALEASGCSEGQRAALTEKLESAAAAFNGGLIQARKCVGMQMVAQEGTACPQALSNFSRYAGKQRMLFYTRWQDEVKAGLAKCPPPANDAAKPKKRAATARRAPLCRLLANKDSVSGGCDAVPPLKYVEGPSASEMMHANMQSCPAPVQQSARMRADMRVLNYKAGINFCQFGANQFLEAQGGVRCDETIAAYRDHDASMRATLVSAWNNMTAGTGAACRGAGGN